MFNRYRHERAVQALLSDILTRQGLVMAAFDDLTAALTNLSTVVGEVPAAVGQGLTDAQAEAFVTQINDLATQLQNDITPPPAG